ncbi:MAG: 5-formyltetrahydrofolate cyclo-ligase [Treponema sp.]|nr:5-formyltetrahydrofolate cyclo-ligase [Treponema sp.]
MEKAQAAVPAQKSRSGAFQENIKTAKKAARANARLLLKGLSAAERENQSQKAAASFLNSSIYKSAECVAAFFSLADEVDVFPIIVRAFIDKKRVLLPRIVAGSNAMDFYELAAPVLGLQSLASALGSQTEANAWGIREPLATLPLVSKEKIPARTAILVPGLAFCKDGRRLGRGKGFYDRYLSELVAQNAAFAERGKICGYCMAVQVADTVPTEENDVRVQELFCG